MLLKYNQLGGDLHLQFKQKKTIINLLSIFFDEIFGFALKSLDFKRFC